MKEVLFINTEILRAGARVLRAIKNKTRQKILKEISAKGKINVTDLYKGLHLEQSVVSSHLKILRDSRFVITKRAGKEI